MRAKHMTVSGPSALTGFMHNAIDYSRHRLQGEDALADLDAVKHFTNSAPRKVTGGTNRVAERINRALKK